MTSTPPQPGTMDLGASGLGNQDELDAANRSLADALRKSFGILKLLMLVLVVLYFLSGWFSVRQNEVGVILRFGRIVGTSESERMNSAVVGPGWHWSWPYPFERWLTISTSEREIPVEFMFERTEEEEIKGITGYKYGSLSPARDDYVITGDVNILHVTLKVKYKINDAVAYLTNMLPMPDPEAGLRSSDYRRYPEYTLLTSLVRDAVIETAARREALHIRGEAQQEFIDAVASGINQKLNTLRVAGFPTGIVVDPGKGVVASSVGGLEAIFPPRQVQESFDRVSATQEQRNAEIKRASAQAESLLLETAGPDHARIAAEIQREFDLMLALSAAESAAKSAGDGASQVEQARQALRKQREATESLFTSASGEVQQIINEARTRKSETIKQASGDFNQFQAVLPEYRQNPRIFMQRFLDDAFAAALNNEKVDKVFVPREARQYRLHIPRSPKEQPSKERDEKRMRGKISTKDKGASAQPIR